MANSSKACLSQEELEQAASGSSGGAWDNAPDSRGDHLAQCPRCRSAVDSIRQTNVLLDELVPSGVSSLADILPSALPLIEGYDQFRERYRGGQGVVYEAVQRSTGRRVAIKVMGKGPLADPGERIRFEREVQILAQLKHPHIVTIHDSGSAGGLSYIVMDLVEGPALDEYVHGQVEKSKNRKVETEGVLRLFADIAEAVNAAHVKGVIHRDLKPSNIRVVCDEHTGLRTEDSGLSEDRPARPRRSVLSPQHSAPIWAKPMILDFGLARLTDDSESARSLTFTGQFIGSLPYASPEQAEGRSERIDTRSDVYALGVTMYQLLTGRFPYDVSGNLPDVLNNIRHAQPAGMRRKRGQAPLPTGAYRGSGSPPTSDITASGAKGPDPVLHPDPFFVDDEIETIVLKCLSKEPERRYQTAGELARDIQHYLADEPVEAKRDSAGYVLRKTLRRYRAAVAVSIAFLLLISGSAVLLGILYQRQVGERKRADDSAVKATAEASKQEAVNAFLQRLLGAADLGLNPKGREMSVREALDKAAAEVDAGALKGQPEVEAAVLETLGKAYVAMSEFDSAEKHLQRSLELRERQFGRRSDQVGQALGPLGNLRVQQGRLKDAEPLLREALETFEAVHGRNSTRVALALNDLGIVLRELSRLDEAEPLLRESLELRQRLLSEDSEAISLALHNLAALMDSRGNYAESESLYLRALALRQTASVERLRTLSNLSIAQGRLDKLPEAEEKLREALAVGQRIFGPEHPQVANLIHNLAMALRFQSKFDEAKPLFETSLAMRRKLLGNDHPILSSSLSGLGALLQAQGQFTEAEALMREAVAVQTKAHGPEHADTWLAQNTLGMVLYDQDRLSEAETIYRELVQIHREQMGTTHPQHGTFLDNLGQVLKRQGQLDEAATVTRESLTIRRAKLPPRHRQVTLATIHLGEILLLLADPAALEEAGRLLSEGRDHHGQSKDTAWKIAETEALYGGYLAAIGRCTEAEPLVLTGYDAVKDRDELPRREKQEALERVVRLYESWEAAEPGTGKAERAAQWRAMSEAP